MSSVALLDSDFPDRSLEREQLTAAGHELVEEPGSGEDVEALLVQWRRVDAAELDRWPSLRVVGRLGLGLDNIDLDECRSRGIAVVNSGDYSTEEVATHAVSLALALVRRVMRSDADVRAGRWIADIEPAQLQRLSGLVVGVVGLGRIGRRVVGMFDAAFGCETIGYDPFAPSAPEGVRRVESLEELLAASDIVTLHLPLSAATRHLIGAEQLAVMRPTAVLVNVARGGLVDQAALIEALEARRIAGAALDVFEDEPLAAGSPLAAFENTVLTPHIGYLSEQALAQARRQMVDDVIAVLDGRDPVHTL